MTREEVENGRDEMLIDGDENKNRRLESAVPDGFNADYLKAYYGKIFPYVDMFKWLSYGNAITPRIHIFAGFAPTEREPLRSSQNTRLSIVIETGIVALRLGLLFVLRYLGRPCSIKDTILGVSYASAGAEIIFSGGSELGPHISPAQQIEQVTDTIQQFILTTGEEATTDLILSSVFYHTNGYIHPFLLNASDVLSVYLPWSFNQFLAHTIKQEIKDSCLAKTHCMGLIAQRKEKRKAQVQHKHAQGIAGISGFSAFSPGGYPRLYYRVPGVLQVPGQPELLHQPQSMRRSWMQTGQVKYAPTGRLHGNNKGFGVSYAGSSMVGSFTPKQYGVSCLATAPPKQQKQIFGEHLYPPLVSQCKPNLAAK